MTNRQQQTERYIGVGVQLPKALSPGDLMRALNITRATFYRRESEGDFKPWLLPRPIGVKRYSGERVQAFLDGRTSP